MAHVLTDLRDGVAWLTLNTPEERNTLTPSFPGLNNRAFIVKINRLFRL